MTNPIQTPLAALLVVVMAVVAGCSLRGLASDGSGEPGTDAQTEGIATNRPGDGAGGGSGGVASGSGGAVSGSGGMVGGSGGAIGGSGGVVSGSGGAIGGSGGVAGGTGGVAGGTGGRGGGAGCTPETDSQICTRLGRICGTASATDNCGTARTPSCGAASRPCSQGGSLGTCAGGNQTCNAQGQWGACSIQPAPSGTDTCAVGNDDNCNGVPNEGCLCIEGATRNCGPCNDGTQTCTNGKAGTYGPCTGGTTQSVFYRDLDGDTYGGTTTVVACSAPAGYVAIGGDCCDADARVNPGATDWFASPATACGATFFDYNCDGTETKVYDSAAACNGTCIPAITWQSGVVPPCGAQGQLVACRVGTQTFCGEVRNPATQACH